MLWFFSVSLKFKCYSITNLATSILKVNNILRLSSQTSFNLATSILEVNNILRLSSQSSFLCWNTVCVILDDEPEDGPQYYVLLLGFCQPTLLAALDSMGVYVSNTIRLSSQDREDCDRASPSSLCTGEIHILFTFTTIFTAMKWLWWLMRKLEFIPITVLFKWPLIHTVREFWNTVLTDICEVTDWWGTLEPLPRHVQAYSYICTIWTIQRKALRLEVGYCTNQGTLANIIAIQL